jgi:putative zinc finger/helix-turn-helix YgiT family protein
MEKAMKCENCGAQMKSGRENYQYRESGLENVTLVGLEVRHCPNCGEHEAVIPAIAELHRVLAYAVALKPSRLVPAEMRFLRKYFGYGQEEFAALLGTRPETVSRWENGKQPMNPMTERALRLLTYVKAPVKEHPPEEVFKTLSEIDDRSPKPVLVKATNRRKGWTAQPEVVAA